MRCDSPPRPLAGVAWWERGAVGRGAVVRLKRGDHVKVKQDRGPPVKAIVARSPVPSSADGGDTVAITTGDGQKFKVFVSTVTKVGGN